jgi:molybdate transport system substrate-binding protein
VNRPRGLASAAGIAALLVACVVLAFAGPAAAAAPTGTPLNVFAAASLSDAFKELGTMFERQHPGTTVRFNFAGSQQLAAQIDQGASADLFASADENWMGWLAERGHIEGEATIFAHNHLVVVVPSSNPARIEKLQDLARRGVKLVIGGASVPVGAYSREMLMRLSVMPGYGRDFATRVLANVVSEEENVKAVAFKVQIAEADAGIVYRSDVNPSSMRYLTVFEVPDTADPMATYPIAVVRGSTQPELARAFITMLRSDAGRGVLTRYRFEAGTH